MDISRDDALILLMSMGVNFPKDTKMSEADLNKRLLQALDAAQVFAKMFPSTPFNPSSYPTWVSSQPLVEVVKRLNITEGYHNATTNANKRATLTPSTAKEDTFMQVRQIMMSLGYSWDKGDRRHVLQDMAQESAIIIEVLGVFELDENTPLFTLLYKVVHKTNELSLNDCLSMYLDGLVTTCSTTIWERKIMYKLLNLNSKRLHSDYRQQQAKDDYRLSFLMPLGPLSMRDVGKLSINIGCEICGQRQTSKCSRCLSVSYCGAECQRQDWKNHKNTCRSLAGGTWRTLNFERFPPNSAICVINRLDTLHDAESRIEPAGKIQADIHNDKIFLVKIQKPLEPTADPMMMIYDRQKSFHAYWKKRSNPELYHEAEEEIVTTGWRGLKMYRWARRTGDFQLSVCFNRAPDKDPVW